MIGSGSLNLIANKYTKNYLTNNQIRTYISSTPVLLLWTMMEEWSYFDYHGELKSKRTKICITCSHFRYTTDAHCRTLLTWPLHEKLIPQGDHLIKGCQYWKKDVRVFAPEAA